MTYYQEMKTYQCLQHKHMLTFMSSEWSLVIEMEKKFYFNWENFLIRIKL